MNIEELLKPRYKVVAEYPGSPLLLEDILTYDERGYFYNFNMHCVINPERYPAIFKPLEWWEERAADEMPEYVKDNYCGEVHKVSAWTGINSFGRPLYTYKQKSGNEGQTFVGITIVPATKEEYGQYQSSLTTN